MLTPNDPRLAGIATPALVIDTAALDSNIQRMAGIAQRRGVALRPHAKTHKCAEIAGAQIAAGAVGICCATVAEAAAMSAAGVAGILITAPVMGRAAFERVANLNRRSPLRVVVDHPLQVGGLEAALRPDDPALEVLIDVDVGQARTGVTTVGDELAIARAVAASPRMRLAGLQGYAGHVQHIVEAGQRRAAAEAASGILGSYAQALTGAGHKPAIITGSGTGAHAFDLDSGPYTELQVGSYVFMDADYARVLDDEGAGPAFAPSLFVLASVVSANRPDQITVDAGTKALATNGPPPCRMIGVPDGASYRFGGDEHGIIAMPAGARPPGLGAKVLIGATHCDPTVNLHARYHAVRGDAVEQWAVLGRYA